MFDVMFIFADGFYRAGFLTRNRDVDDCMVRAALVTDTTADTGIVVDMSLAGLLVEMDGTFRTVHIAASCHASTAQVTYFVVDLYAGRTSFIDDTKDVFLDFSAAFERLLCIFG